MSNKLSVQAHLTDTELAERVATAKESGEWRRWMAPSPTHANTRRSAESFIAGSLR